MVNVVLEIIRCLGVVEGRMKLMKLAFLVDYEHYLKAGQQLSEFDWIYHYYGPYSREVIETVYDLEHEGTIVEYYDPCQGIWVYEYVGSDSSGENFVRNIVEKYGNLSGEELKNECYKILDNLGVRPGERIFSKNI